MPNGIDGVAVIVVVVVVVVVVGARKPERVQQVHELIAPADRPSSCRFVPLDTVSSPRPSTYALE